MKFIDLHQDRWHSVVNEAELQPSPRANLLLSLDQWLALRDHWPAGLACGVLVPNDADIESLEQDLPRLGLIALQFPQWVDGRAYSQARLLRSRYRYVGEVRAVGHVLVDMLPLLARTGFDAVLMRPDQSVAAAQRALGFFPAHYQGDVSDNRPWFLKRAAAADKVTA